MRADIVPGAMFPDYELDDHTTKRRKLSELQGQNPMVLVLGRGGYCPKDRGCSLSSREASMKALISLDSGITIFSRALTLLGLANFLGQPPYDGAEPRHRRDELEQRGELRRCLVRIRGGVHERGLKPPFRGHSLEGGHGMPETWTLFSRAAKSARTPEASSRASSRPAARSIRLRTG